MFGRRLFLVNEDFLGDYVHRTVLAADANADNGSRRLEMVTKFEVSPLSGMHPVIEYQISAGGRLKCTFINVETAIREYNATMNEKS